MKLRKMHLSIFWILIPYDPKQYMIIDSSTCRNLELVETINDKSRRGSLLGVLDKSSTAMGKRLLRSMIEQPLCSVRGINERLDAVEAFVKNPIDREELREYLGQVYDIERLLWKNLYWKCHAKGPCKL